MALFRLCSISYAGVYLLEHSRAGAIEVGVASGPRRVAVPRGCGYRPVAQWSGLDHVTATDAERAPR